MRIPGVVLHMVPEAEWCCGNLCNKEKLVQQITDQLETNLRLQQALREVAPEHPLLKEFENGNQHSLCSLKR